MNTQTFSWGDYGSFEGSIFIGNAASTNCNSSKYSNVKAYKGGVLIGEYHTSSAAAYALHLSNGSVSKSIASGIPVSGYTFTADKKSA